MSDPAAPHGEDPRVEELRLTLAGRTINSLCDELETLRRENAKLRETNTALNRRATRAEAIVAQRVEEQERKGKSLGRSLANAGYYALKAENAKLREALEAAAEHLHDCPSLRGTLLIKVMAALDPSSTGTR